MTDTQFREKDRIVRVFVSSTFRDMTAERDELVKFIFPELRRFCRERDVEFVDVDLRWGVTEEQTERGETLAICLAEIEHCRPYFIGILGERYGWVPGKFSEEAVTSNSWLKNLVDRSVTELEILHGVLNNPVMAQRSYFYFRDPAYLEKTPTDKRRDYLSENEQAAEKLANLKQRIRQSGLPLVENYTDPHSVALQIGANLRQVIDIDFPVGEERDRLAEEATGHETYARSRSKVYIGREKDLAYIDKFVSGTPIDVQKPDGLPVLENSPVPLQPPIIKKSTGFLGSLKQLFNKPNKPISTPVQPPQVSEAQKKVDKSQKASTPGGEKTERVLVVLGPSGCGKSALLANWVLRYRHDHPDDYIFLHFLGSTPDSSDYIALLRRLLLELKARFGIPLDLPDTPKELIKAFPNWLAMAAVKCSRLTIVLDGLNQLEDYDQAPDLVWLPEYFPENVRVLVSTLPGRSLEALRLRLHAEMEVRPLNEVERLRLVNDYLGFHKKSLEERRARRIAAAEPAGNPLYLRVLIEELRQLGSFEELDNRIGYYLQARSIDDLFELVLERLENDYERQRPGLVKEALSLIWSARHGLNESELLELLRDLPRVVWSPLYLALEEALVVRGGVINFFHDFLRQAVHDRYLSEVETQREMRIRLADYFDQRELDNRQVEELPWLLAQTENWQRLYELLCKHNFLVQSWNLSHYDIGKYWATIEQNSELKKTEAYRREINNPSLSEVTPIVDYLLFQSGEFDSSYRLNLNFTKSLRDSSDLRNLQVSLKGQARSLEALGKIEDALTLLKESEAISDKLGDMNELQENLCSQASILWSTGKSDEALKLLATSKLICRENRDEQGLAACLGIEGNILKDIGNLDDSMKAYKEQERIYHESGEYEGLALSLGNQAVILQDYWGMLDKAMELHKRKENICRQLGLKNSLHFSIINQAIILTQWGKTNEAMNLLKEQEQICRKEGYKDGLQRTLGNQAIILRDLNKREEAIELLNGQEQICRELRNTNDLQKSLGNKALIFRDWGKHSDAMKLFQEQERICREFGYLGGLQNSLGNQALIFNDWDMKENALEILEEQEQICRKLGDNGELLDCLTHQAKQLFSMGRIEETVNIYNEMEQISRTTNNCNVLQKSLNNHAVLLLKSNRIDEAVILLNESVKICREFGFDDELHKPLINQAGIFINKKEFDKAMVLLIEAESSCKKQGNFEDLQVALGNQGVILMNLGKLDESMKVLKEQERICRELNNQYYLEQSISNQAVCLSLMQEKLNRRNISNQYSPLEESEAKFIQDLISNNTRVRQQALGEILKLGNRDALGYVEAAIKKITGLNDIQYYEVKFGRMRATDPNRTYIAIMQLVHDKTFFTNPGKVQSLIPGIGWKNDQLMSELHDNYPREFILYQLLGIQMQLKLSLNE
jgi:tetratricopeptide (TPR) repeat protein